MSSQYSLKKIKEYFFPNIIIYKLSWFLEKLKMLNNYLIVFLRQINSGGLLCVNLTIYYKCESMSGLSGNKNKYSYVTCSWRLVFENTSYILSTKLFSHKTAQRSRQFLYWIMTRFSKEPAG